MGISQKMEALGMYSADGEFVEFNHSVFLEGPVEVSVTKFLDMNLEKINTPRGSLFDVIFEESLIILQETLRNFGLLWQDELVMNLGL